MFFVRIYIIHTGKRKRLEFFLKFIRNASGLVRHLRDVISGIVPLWGAVRLYDFFHYEIHIS